MRERERKLGFRLFTMPDTLVGVFCDKGAPFPVDWIGSWRLSNRQNYPPLSTAEVLHSIDAE